MQGKSGSNRELLDAAALCRQLVAEGSVEAFLADHRRELFPDELFTARSETSHPSNTKPLGTVRTPRPSRPDNH